MASAGKATPNAGNGDQPREDSVVSQLIGLAAALWASRHRGRVILLLVALVAVVGASAYAQILLNAWNQPFYDALSRKDVSSFIVQLGVFAELAGVLLVLNVAQAWLNLKSKLILRKRLVEDLAAEWLAPLRAVRLWQIGEIGENPDQRIHEDARHLTELSTDLGIGLLQSSLLLLSFVGVLWILSDNMVVTIAGRAFVLPGYMVWCALLYSGVVSLLSWLVGRPLIHLNAERYAREAQFRFALVRVNEEIEGVTLDGGEADEKERLDWFVRGIIQVFEQIIVATTWLTSVTAGFGWLAIVAPILIAAPAYFFGAMTFGKLMMVVGAFNQVQQALGWFANNFSSIADWRATLLRVVSFRTMLLTIDKVGESQSQIELDGRHEESIVIDELWIATPEGRLTLTESHLEVKPGDHVLITGDRDAERKLFQAIAGLWPWGGGRVARPRRQSIVFMPTPGYVPPGTLREALAYPHPPQTYDDARIREVFTIVGLDHLAPMLDENERWDRRLSDNDKQCLAVVRVLLQKPHWVVLNRALAALDHEVARRVAAAFERHLADVGVIYIGPLPNGHGHFPRVVNLVLDPQGPRFKPSVKAEALDPREAAAASSR
ncbi:MAG: ABC transporter ATP-binding protein/permease [Roseiarcus sp.]|jgi:putative ATP-binding cassette transporter